MIFDYLRDGFEGVNDSGRNPRQTPDKPADFDEDANDLWSLYGKEAKSHDEEWIKVLKEDMDSVLIFVCAYFFSSVSVGFNPIPGWFILCRSHRVRRPKDPRLESEPRGPVSLSPESNS